MRLIRHLESTGFDVVHEQGPWDWDYMMQAHVYNTEGQEGCELSTTEHDEGEHHLLTVTWKKEADAGER